MYITFAVDSQEVATCTLPQWWVWYVKGDIDFWNLLRYLVFLCWSHWLHVVQILKPWTVGISLGSEWRLYYFWNLVYTRTHGFVISVV